jgi:hypothetical protein
VLNRNCGEDKGEEMQVAVFYGQSHGKSFGDSEGILLVEFLERGATVDSERYVQTLKKLKQRIWRVWSNGKISQVVIRPTAAI